MDKLAEENKIWKKPSGHWVYAKNPFVLGRMGRWEDMIGEVRDEKQHLRMLGAEEERKVEEVQEEDVAKTNIIRSEVMKDEEKSADVSGVGVAE